MKSFTLFLMVLLTSAFACSANTNAEDLAESFVASVKNRELQFTKEIYEYGNEESESDPRNDIQYHPQTDHMMSLRFIDTSNAFIKYRLSGEVLMSTQYSVSSEGQLQVQFVRVTERGFSHELFGRPDFDGHQLVLRNTFREYRENKLVSTGDKKRIFEVLP